MIYLNNFDTHTSYEEKLNVGGIDFKIPNVSYCNDVKDVHFNPYNLIKFYVGEITGTTPQTVSIYTDSSTSIPIQVSKGNKWYSYAIPKNKGLCAITGKEQLWGDDIITKVIAKANINYYQPTGLFNPFTSFITESVVEASFKGSNTSKVTNMNDMFLDCRGLTSLDVSGWDTSKVTTMNQMFKNCTKLETLDLSGWDTSNVTDMNGMFNSCLKLKEIKMIGCSKDTIEKIRTYLANEDITGAKIIQ